MRRRSTAWGPTVVGWLLGLASLAYLLALPPTLNPADESFILYGAKRVYQGEALYRDFFDFLTPGSFYLYALSYAVGGVSITSARVTTALLNALAATCTYFLALRVAGMGEAVIAGLLVVVLCVPVWNMASHHWIATAFGLASAAVVLAPRWQDSSRARPAAAGALAGVLVSTHQGRGTLFIVWLVVTMALLVASRSDDRRGRRCCTELLWTAAGGAAVCLPVFGYAVWRASLADMLYATHTWVTENYRRYHVGLVPWGGYGSYWAVGLRFTSHWLMRAIPVLLGMEAVSLLWSAWRYGWFVQRMRLVIFLLALGAVGGIMYFPDIAHVAFVMPFVMIALAGMVHRVRTAFVWSDRALPRAFMRAGWAVVLAGVLAKGWTNARAVWADYPVPFDTAFGRLAGTQVTVEVFGELRRLLQIDPAHPPRLFAHSTDAWMYLMLPADNPTRFALLRPVYNTPQQIGETIDRLDRDPDAVVLVNLLTVKPDDPVLTHLASWPEVTAIGPWLTPEIPLYRLYRRPARQ